MSWFKAITNTVRTGIVVALYPYDETWTIEIQRAPESGGEVDSANAVTIGFAGPGQSRFLDLLPLDGANRYYRSRHVAENATASGWTNWSKPRTPTTVPDPLPPVPSLQPKIDVVATVSATSLSLVATATLGELEYGNVEFQDPERSFASAGSITATDTTLTISGGDLTDEDVGKYVSVADAGPSGGLLKSRIASVTSATECELADAATGTVASKTVVVGGGWYSDFDYDGTDETQETNTRNRPESDADASWIMFRATVDNEASSPQQVDLPIQIAPALLRVDCTVHDDGSDNDYSTSWQVNATVTDSMFIEFTCYENDAVATTATENDPLTNSSKTITDVGAGDGGSDTHYVRFVLKDASGNTLDTKESRRFASTT